MKTLLTILLLVAASNAFSQFTYPSLSPKGRVEQTVGFTDVAIDYERPSARGRVVFGELVKYDSLWRTGAGNCTKIRFNKPVTINSKKIEAGTYSVFSIPGKSEWTVILNADTTLYGTSKYDKTKDVFRFKAKSHSTNRYYESLTMDIDVVPNNAVVYIAWEKTEISFKIDTESDKVIEDFVQQQLMTNKSNIADEYGEAAEYYYYMNKNLDRALLLMDKAIEKKNEAWYYRQKVDILEKLGRYKEAIDCAMTAMSVNQKRTEWNAETRQRDDEQYKKRIAYFKSKLKG